MSSHVFRDAGDGTEIEKHVYYWHCLSFQPTAQQLLLLLALDVRSRYPLIREPRYV